MHQSGLNTDRPIYCGRDAAASPATGSAGRHAKEQRSLVQQSLLLSEKKVAAE